MNVDAMPKSRTVLEFEFSGTYAECRRFWLVVDDGRVDMCLKDPGYEVDLVIRADIRRFVEAWRGFRDLRAEIASGQIVVEGPTDYRRALPDWLLLSGLAPLERKRSGVEQDLVREAANAAAE
jgi:hypothetical protein